MRYVYLCLSVLLTLTTGCSDLTEGTGANSSQDKYVYGESSKIIYDCVTATRTADGSKWTYRVSSIMNLLDQVSVRGSQIKPNATSPTDYGHHWLSKSYRDTFTNGNLTVVLTNKSNGGKSISVEHNTMNIFARAENGHCIASQSDLPFGEDSGTNVPAPGAIKGVPLIGEWVLDPSFGSSDFTLRISDAFTGNAETNWQTGTIRSTGTISSQVKCHALLDLGVEDYIAGNRAVSKGERMATARSRAARTPQTAGGRAVSALMLLLDAISLITVYIEYAHCNSNPEHLINQWQNVRYLFGAQVYNYDSEREFPNDGAVSTPFYLPQFFVDACTSRQGSYPIYGHLYSGHIDSHATGFICFNHFEAGNGYPEAIEVLESGTQTNQMGNWVRWIRK